MTTALRTSGASVRTVGRVLAGAALLAIVSLTSLQAIAPSGGSAVAATSDACGTVLAKPSGGNWACSLVDNFNGSSLDSSKWLIHQTSVTGFYYGLTCFTTSSKNVQVYRGELRLTARSEGSQFTCKTPTGGFTTKHTGGTIVTRTGLAQTYGRFEVRAKFPSVTKPGVHGAFWMVPPDLEYGPWPKSGEIDIAEWWSNDPTLVLPSLHYEGEDFWVDSGWDCRVTTPSSYHTYTLEWLPTGMSFFIDGNRCFTRMPEPDEPLVAPQPFDQPFSMILSMGVGSAGGTNPLSSATPLPATFTVDYAKAWR